MNNIVLCPISIDELTAVISQAVKVEVEAFKNSFNQIPNNDLITRKEAAKILGVSLPTLNTRTKDGDIPAYRTGSSVRYKKEEVINSLNKVKGVSAK